MTFRMCTKCSCWEHVKQSVPVLEMFLICSYLFPGTLAPSVCLAILRTPSELVSDANPGSQSHIWQVSDPSHDPPHSFEDRQHNIADCSHHWRPCLKDEQDPFDHSTSAFNIVPSSCLILLGVICVPPSPQLFTFSAVLLVQKLSYNQGWLVSKRPEEVFHVISGCGQIGQISRMMATLETVQDPPYEASELREDTSQRHRETLQLVGSKHRSVATRDAQSKHWSFGGVVA